MAIERLDGGQVAALGEPSAVAARLRALVAAAPRWPSRSLRSSPAVREGGEQAVLDYTRRFDTAGGGAGAAAGLPGGARRGDQPTSARAGRRAAGRDRQRRHGSPRRESGRRGRVQLPQGQTHSPARGARRVRRGLCARWPRPLPEHRRDGCRHGSGGRRDRRRRLRPARTGRRHRPGDPRHLQALRRRTGLPDGRRPGDRGAGTGHRDGPAGRRDRRVPGNLYVQEAKHQLSTLVGIDGFAGPSDLLVVLGARGRRAGDHGWPAWTCWPRESTERAAWSSAVSPSGEVCDALASSLEQMILRAPDRRGRRLRGRRGPIAEGSHRARQCLRPRAPRADRRRGRGALSDRPIGRLPVRRRRVRDGLRGLCRRLEPHPPDRRCGPFRLGSDSPPLPPPDDRGEGRWRCREAGRRRRADRPGRGLRGPRRIDGGPCSGE